MFDPITASLLRAAPALPQLDPVTLPQTLTRRYAQLVARRLRRSDSEALSSMSQEEGEQTWPLARIADAYELLTSIHSDPAVKRAAAFVAATAQQILAHEARETDEQRVATLSRDAVDPDLAASLLFLAAEQYADANEAAQRIRSGAQGIETVLIEDIRDFAAGNLEGVLRRASRRPEYPPAENGLEALGLAALFESLVVGIELLAADALGEAIPANASRFASAQEAFRRVLDLSSSTTQGSLEPDSPRLVAAYPGPRHLAALLLAAHAATAQSVVTKIPLPPSTDAGFWKTWLRHRAKSAPFLWRNHREAIGKGFHVPGISAVMVLPTGAGKTTVSCLKIASALGRGKSVVFIAPTHALVEQLTADLQEFFPEALLGSIVSSDFDRLFVGGTTLRRIEVMTPERCLALLSYAPGAFSDVGLLVFDECHLLSPISGLRRALDGMFCVLGFNSIAAAADFLFLSAMLKNGEQYAKWIESLTGRDCVFVDPLWKPSRQARGVVCYEAATIAAIQRTALDTQQQVNNARGVAAKGLRRTAQDALVAQPFALFGLRHDWLNVSEKKVDCTIAKISESNVVLSGVLRGGRVNVKPNVNIVAAHIAAASVRSGLKVIVFVNVKSHAVSTARAIAREIGLMPEQTADETERWAALEAELGGLRHSLLAGPSSAVPHNSEMIRLERDLAETMFRRPDGAMVIVATPTLAQGLNLPAHLAILASDMRVDPDAGGRKALGAHEILNAAARAGRAGHLANGVALLIPEAMLTFTPGKPLRGEVVDKLRAVLPEDDRCIDLVDPLQSVLDRISQGVTGDEDVEYALNRLSTAITPEGNEVEPTTRFPLQKSFAAFSAAARGASEVFITQTARLNEVLAERSPGYEDATLLDLAAQSGTPVAILLALSARLAAYRDQLPGTIADWMIWIFDWLSEDEDSRSALFSRWRVAFLGAVGRRADSELNADALRELLPGVLGWLSGEALEQIEQRLGGNPDHELECPRARRLVTSLVPMALAFVAGVVAGIARHHTESEVGTAPHRLVLETLHTAVRRGFDSPFKLAFAEVRRGLLGRVQIHKAYAAEIGGELVLEDFEDFAAVVALMRLLV